MNGRRKRGREGEEEREEEGRRKEGRQEKKEGEKGGEAERILTQLTGCFEEHLLSFRYSRLEHFTP